MFGKDGSAPPPNEHFGPKEDGFCTKCCKGIYNCCRSIPWASLVSALMAAAGFALSVKGWVRVNKALQSIHFDMGAVESYVGFGLGATLALDVVIIIFAFCATGKTRELCCSGDSCAKKCGRCMLRFANLFFAFIVYLTVAINLLLILVFALMALAQFFMSQICHAIAAGAKGITISMEDFGFGVALTTADEINNFCVATDPVKQDLALMFAGAIVTLFAQVQMLVCVCVNFVRVGLQSKLGRDNDRTMSMPFLHDA